MSKTSSSRFRNTSKAASDLEGKKLITPKEFKGLGHRYFSQLGQESNKVLQVDTAAGITETKGSVRCRSIQLAVEMKKRGVEENSIVVIFSKNHANQTIALLASLFLGAVVAPFDPEFSNTECLELLKKLKPKMCFCDTRPMSQVHALLSNLKIHSELIHFGVENEGIPFQSLFGHKKDEKFQPASIADPQHTVAFILPTQGTTSPPKLVCLSHHSIYVQTKSLLDIFNYPEKIISSFPLSWILQTLVACASFEAGVIRIMCPVTLTQRNTCKMIHHFEIGHAIFSVGYARDLISNAGIKDYNLNCLKCVLLSAVNTKYEIQSLKKLLPHVSFLQCYYLTETGCIAVTTEANYIASLDRPNSVGRLSHNCKIKIVDLDTKEHLSQDNYGELYFSGDGMMLGYLRENEKTKLSMDKGYFKTGDMAMYDEDGWLYIKGRIEDLIVMDNYRLCPSELEAIILEHPYVKDVVVVGNRKEIIACVVKNTEKTITAEKLLKYISERVPESNRPTKIIFMDSFPRTSIGHILKKQIREKFLTIRIGYATSLSSISTVP